MDFLHLFNHFYVLIRYFCISFTACYFPILVYENMVSSTNSLVLIPVEERMSFMYMVKVVELCKMTLFVRQQTLSYRRYINMTLRYCLFKRVLDACIRHDVYYYNIRNYYSTSFRTFSSSVSFV